MKKFALLILLVAGGIFAYTHFMDVEPASAEQRRLQALEDQFRGARDQFTQASRTAGLSGMDMTGDVEGVIRTVQRLEAELAGLKNRLTAAADRERADRLTREIQEFKRRLGT